MDMNSIMRQNFGESSNEIKVSFRKTCVIRQYETEVIELENKIVLDRDVPSGERMFIGALMQAQLEYAAYINLAFNGLVTNDELAIRRKSLEDELIALKNRVEAETGLDLDKYQPQE